MHVYRREKGRLRRGPSPEWAQNNEQTTELILKFLEARFYTKCEGSNAERRQQVEKAAASCLPQMRQALADHVLRYNAAVKSGATEKELETIAIEIQNQDTQIVLTERGVPAILSAVVYCYYRLGWDSTAIAEEFGVKPPMVRIWLYRLNQLAGGRRRQRRKDRGSNLPWTPERVKMVSDLRASGKSARECGDAMELTTSSIWYAFRKFLPNPTNPTVPQPPGRVVVIEWDEDRLKKLFALRTSGKTLAECAIAFGRSTASIYQIWARNFGDLNIKFKTGRRPKPGSRTVTMSTRTNGVKRIAYKIIQPSDLPRRHSSRAWTLERLSMLRKLRDEGKSVGQCAEALGTTIHSASYALHRVCEREGI